ncbi:hypothetical protein pneo_cds_28 [Pandoravirus neocaledonia]|uniref:Uncharacterized protein n=1 Tax=Pandoravirus neocaledonia TaxID=2107708 RepID=A0A2U7UB89_9VIRU|nr:hypothetical protein pneo_cds_28 [Pandoravirus neocaledonia]AVK75635.1 hypothetical protein pneo_cds_28 [Pandoravirus neocaledonia]
MATATTVHCAYHDEFWRVADTQEGDLAALAILTGALLSLLCASAYAFRACALLRDRGDPRSGHRHALPSMARTCPTPRDQTAHNSRQQDNHRRGRLDDDNNDDDDDDNGYDAHRFRSAYAVCVGAKAQGQEAGKECDQEVPRQQAVLTWEDKWRPALADPEGFAAARIRARKEAVHRATTTAATTTRRSRAHTYARPLSLDALVALERTAARAATLPDPH